MRPTDRNGFKVAIICALIPESDAFEALFDEFWEEDEIEYGKAPGDPNSYTLGRIGRHPAVLTYMPSMGKSSAAAVSASLRISFPSIKLVLVVGICGGVPESIHNNRKVSIFLGDVIVSTGVVQFDFGRQYDDRVVRKDTLKDNLSLPTSELRLFLHRLQWWRGRKKLRDRMKVYIADICSKEDFSRWARPQLEKDKLYAADYRHKHQDPDVCDICAKCVSADTRVCDAALELSCDQLGCDKRKLVIRKRTSNPRVHFGYIGCGDQIMRSAVHRDRIAHQEKLLGFEMEGTGVWDNLPTIIVKGVCDYADSHKSKVWQKYASVTAASCAKALLSQWRSADKGLSSADTNRAMGSARKTDTSSAANIRSIPDTSNEDDARNKADYLDKQLDTSRAFDISGTVNTGPRDTRKVEDTDRAEDTHRTLDLGTSDADSRPETSRTPETTKAEGTTSTADTIQHEKYPNYSPAGSTIFNNSAKVGNQAVTQHFAGPVTFTQS